jgi:hypothetical protein
MVKVLSLLFMASFSACFLIADSEVTPTFFFQDAVQLQAGGVPINLGNHSAPRLVDWDGDGDLDLLVGGGDGYIWIFLNSGSASNPYFQTGVKVHCSGVPIQAGTWYTGVCFEDLSGDGLPDLIIAHSNDRIRIYTNVGILSNPEFTGYSSLQGPTGELYLPDNCDGRIDVEDWNGDGLKDIVAGEFEGYLTVYLNDGNLTSPHFKTGQKLTYNGNEIHWPYNTHPRIFDLNQDGIPDLVFGINWGDVGFYMNDGVAEQYHLRPLLMVRDSNGNQLNLRSLISDDTIPDFADLNNDQVLDMISGGLNGKIFVMYGVSYQEPLNRIEQIMQEHPDDLGQALESDPNLRKELFGLHHGMRKYGTEFLLSAPTRQPIYNWYRSHIDNYPQYLKKQFLDPTIYTYIPSLAGQVWVNLFESLPDVQTHRFNVADEINLQGYYRDMFLDFGTLLIENSCADLLQQEVVYNYLSSLPRDLWDCERLTIADFLGSNLPSEVAIECQSGVNIFGCRVEQYIENSFPPDSETGWVTTFGACLAHEINHSVDAHTISNNPDLYARKHCLIRQAVPSQVIFNPDYQGGVDWTATKNKFLIEGYWDGIEEHWDQVWSNFWSDGPGAAANDRWLRNNLKLMCEAPQEAFATLANQYFTNSRTMLDLALRRWNRGILTCINQFLFFVDVYSCETNRSYFYTMDINGNITKSSVCLQRNKDEYIKSLAYDNIIYEFYLDGMGNVTGISAPQYFDSLDADINCDFCVNIEDLRLLINQWLSPPGIPSADIAPTPNGDGIVNFLDFAIFAENWLWEKIPADIDIDGDVDFTDYAIFASHWVEQNCTEPDWCVGIDFDHNGQVDVFDLAELARKWLAGK